MPYTEHRQPGDLGCIRTAGPVGLGIRAAQWLDGKGFRDYEHVRVYLGDGDVLQTNPGGARINKDRVSRDELWSTGLFPSWQPVTTEKAHQLAQEFVGTGYGYLDYWALTAHRLHIPDLPVWPGWDDNGQPERISLKQFIGQTRTEICSQLGDAYELRLGRHLFADGRWPGFVTPGDISALFLAQAALTGKPVLGRDYA